MSKIEFFADLKTAFYPRLRGAGFTGSGQHFRRVRGEVLQAVNLQGSREGGSCAVNLGIHLAFLPGPSGWGLPDPGGIQEIDCEFRRRLAPAGKHDYWWKYSGPTSPGASACSLVEIFFSVGEPWFERFSTVEAIASEFDYAKMSAGKFNSALGGLIPVRAALTGARVYAHLGNKAESRRFAEWGLTIVGRAVALTEDLEKLAHAE